MSKFKEVEVEGCPSEDPNVLAPIEGGGPEKTPQGTFPVWWLSSPVEGFGRHGRCAEDNMQVVEPP